MLAFLERMGRKFLGASLASGTLLAGFVFVAVTGKGVASFAEFVNGIVMVFGTFSAGNAAATWATAKLAKPEDKKTAKKPEEEGEA